MMLERHRKSIMKIQRKRSFPAEGLGGNFLEEMSFEARMLGLMRQGFGDGAGTPQ